MRFGRTEVWRLGVPSTGARPSGIGVRLSGARHEDRWNVGNEAQRNVGSEANGNARRSENSAGLEATGSESEATGELPRL